MTGTGGTTTHHGHRRRRRRWATLGKPLPGQTWWRKGRSHHRLMDPSGA